MLIDSRSLEAGTTVYADICIVGAGVAGVALAHELAKSNLEVALVESGDRQPNPRMQSLNIGQNIGIPYYDLDRARARAFGGTSHLWHCDIGTAQLGVRLMGLDGIDFEKRDWVPNSGWPFSKADLDPFYVRAHDFCKIGPYTYRPDDWSGAADASRGEFIDQPSPVHTRIFQFARKDFLYDVHRRALEESSNVAVYLNATVLNVRPSEAGGAIEHLDASTPERKRISFRAKHYVLATGGIETARLMLASNDRQSMGLGNSNDVVGRYFMEHPHLWSGYIIPARPEHLYEMGLYAVHRVKGVAIMGKLMLDEGIQRQQQLLNFATSLHPRRKQDTVEGAVELKRIVREASRLRFPRRSAADLGIVIRGWRDLLPYAFDRVLDKLRPQREKSREPNALVLNVMAEQVPNPESRVVLQRERDFLGMSRVSLDWKLTGQDIDSIRRSQELIGQEVHRQSLGKMVVELKDEQVPPTIHGGWHHMGTTRMHEDPRQGVVDANCTVHGISNLHIAGASVFPTVGCANPVLTTVALALRLADHLSKRGQH